MVLSLAGVAFITWAGYRLVPVNATTQGFVYLLLVLIIATTWGFVEAGFASVAATLTLNFYFFEPIGTFTIGDQRNWVALFAFLFTSLSASRLSGRAKLMALDAIAHQQDLERLYSFSRAILLIDNTEPFPKQLVRKISEIFGLSAVVLYERRTGEFYRAGPKDFDGLEDQLVDSAIRGTSFSDQHDRLITAVRLGSEPIAGLALQGVQMADSVAQGISNLVAIGLERARAQDLASQIEAAQQTEKLRTTLVDAMAHELKTPLTSIMAATTALAGSDVPAEDRAELVRIANDEARHLNELIDESLEMARLDPANIQVKPEPIRACDLVHDVAAAMESTIDSRPLEIICGEQPYTIAADRGLMKLALKQLLDNALKYSPPDTPVTVEVSDGKDFVTIAVTDHGTGISAQEQVRIFERLYRSPTVQHRIPGSGLGLSIAKDIVRAHRGDLTVSSSPGETTFRVTLPAGPQEPGEPQGEKD